MNSYPLILRTIIRIEYVDVWINYKNLYAYIDTMITYG